MSRFPVITESALAELRARLGQPVPRPEPYVEVATRDAVRHWTAGIGDRNPVWLEAGVAPPTILFAMDRIVSGYVGGLPGVHAMYGGTDFRWQEPIRLGDRITGDSVLLDLVEKPSRFAKRAIQQIYRTTFRNQRDAVVCVADSWCFRTERDTARERAKYRPTEPASYTTEQIDRIARAYEVEEIRGATRRRAEDVRIGDVLPAVVKPFSPALRARPKSIRYTKSLSVMRMFDGLTSRWISPASCAASRAVATCSTTLTANAGPSGLPSASSSIVPRLRPSISRISR